ncbi:MAG: glutamate 5-kinase [Bradymonadaceae bacterium]|nr:glutamate 5-kinase [Lujinxingiaceae bacterium]
MNRSQIIEPTRHWVVKLGSAVFLRDANAVDRTTFASLIEDIDGLLRRGIRVTLVSSGAVALGRQSLGLGPEPSANIPRLQAFAALGQSRLVQMYETEFAHYQRKVAQILFTRGDLDDRRRFLNARMALEMVHELGAIPIINENDSVATEELRFGDNDQLAAMTCGLVRADLLVILSDVDGIFEVEVDADSGQRRFTQRLSHIALEDERLDHIAGPTVSGVGRGGMVTKVLSARIAGRFGISTVIAPGKRRHVLGDLADGQDLGTLVYAQTRTSTGGTKAWLGTGARPLGKLICDAGAVLAVQKAGASLLASGIRQVEGDFAEGSVVELIGPSGAAFARGVTVYNAHDIRKIAGQHSDAIAQILGFKILDAVVHRDNLVVL